MRSIKIFPDPVWKGTFPGRIDKILSKADNFKSDKNVTTKKLAGHTQKYNTKDYPHDWPELDEFNQWLSKGFQTVWQDWDLKLEPYQDLRFKSWLNYNSKNDYLLNGLGNYLEVGLIRLRWIMRGLDAWDLHVGTPYGFEKTIR